MEDTHHTPAQVIPECHAEKCPVCNGFTTVNYGKQTCAACKGRGYIVVPNQIEVEDRRKKSAHS